MKKIISVVVVLAILAGCGNDDKTHVIPNNDRIKLSPTTIRPGRPAEATIVTMQGDPRGFSVWATATGVSGWWDDTEATPHIYDSGVWNFDPPKQWPMSDPNYPMHFYAVFPYDAAGLQMNADAPSQSLTGSFTVQGAAIDQTDLLRALTTANIKPANGNLSITFHHVLSKIDFGMDLGAGFTASVQGVAVNNVGDSGVYTFSGPTPSWTTVPSTYTASYTYFGTIYPDATGNPTVSTLPAPEYSGNAATVTPFYTTLTNPTADDAHLMLMPQDVPSRTWGGDNAPTAAPTADVSHVSMMYRLQKNGSDLIGYAQAQDHNAFAGSTLQTGGYPATAPLFVKAGYPFELSWVDGKGYIYNILLRDQASDGSAIKFTGGFLLDQNYYDAYGNRTDLVVGDTDGNGTPDGPEVSDPIVDGDDIHLLPDVIDWDEETGI